jgi:predicted transcriptional regulator
MNYLLDKTPTNVILLLGNYQLSNSNDWNIIKISKYADNTYSHINKIVKVLEEMDIVNVKKEGRENIIYLTEKGWKIFLHLNEINKITNIITFNEELKERPINTDKMVEQFRYYFHPSYYRVYDYLTEFQINEIKERDGRKCVYCNRNLRENLKTPEDDLLTFDHIIPFSKGGKTTIKNIVLACWKCNKTKRNLDVKIFCNKMRFKVPELVKRLLKEQKNEEDVIITKYI